MSRKNAVLLLTVPLVLLSGCARTGAESDPAGRSWREPVTGMEFVLLPAGRFRMGSDPEEAARQPDEVPHEVEITRGFYLGRYEVTQGEWVRLMGSNPSHFRTCGPRCPVETVSYDDVQRYIRRLTQASGSGRFRLPTEAEWEYACRAGSRAPFSTGAKLTAGQANYDGRSPLAGTPAGRFLGRPAPVGSYQPNRWGLYDLHGNVWEWCEDWYGDYPAGPVRDPKGPPRERARRLWDARGGDWGLKRVIRGGSWYFGEDSCRCALRYTHAPADKGFSLGFRLVREVKGATRQISSGSAGYVSGFIIHIVSFKIAKPAL
ncbi:MAG TPA: formylglycine-generating enzyme family protein [Thermoanaerobaculia bacterium]|nr:formylglycine-generating enzyme family protein [Thermoanaerobaculia bacterium]